MKAATSRARGRAVWGARAGTPSEKTDEQREEFPPLCPDFVVELRSRTDSLKHLRRKLEEYIANGAQLGWLLDPFERKVYVYRPQTAVEVLDDPQTVSGEPLLRGFALNLQEIWD